MGLGLDSCGKGPRTDLDITWPSGRWCVDLRTRGLCIINTQIMNDCLLVKWIWKIHQEPDELWFKILKAKYMRSGGFFQLQNN
jgi:hypothetical protein